MAGMIKDYKYSSFIIKNNWSIKFSEPLAMVNSLFITPSPMDRGSGLETRPGIEYRKQGNVAPNLPTPTRTLAF
jgi:hypothetical protein